jgi:SAM-dependent methyltransferase
MNGIINKWKSRTNKPGLCRVYLWSKPDILGGMNYDTYAHLYDLVEEGIPGDVEFYCQEASRQKGAILELGAGTGRVTKALLTLGRPVVAVDNSREMLTRLKRHLSPEANLLLVQEDLCTLALEQTFPTILAPFRVLQHLYTVDEQLQALTAIKKHLDPGGYFIFDVFNPDISFLTSLEWRWQEEVMPESAWQKQGIRIEYRSRCDQVTQILHEEYRVTHPDGRVEYIPTSMRYFFQSEFEHLLARSGFTVHECFGDFDRSPVTEDSHDLIWKVSAS